MSQQLAEMINDDNYFDDGEYLYFFLNSSDFISDWGSKQRTKYKLKGRRIMTYNNILKVKE